MEFKVGQWGRSNNIFGEVRFVDGTFYITKDRLIIGIATRNNVANTPQELVKEKDLIRIEYDCDPSEIEEVRKATGTDFICGDGYHISFDDVVEILTPSSNGYDSQWKKGIE